jgi:hypothetical protein
MPVQPETACYQVANFNTASCSWDVTGTMPVQPETACYQVANFNTASCSWDVTGTMPVQPATACYQTATFNTASCSWNVTGTMPVAPVVNCNDVAIFNTETCSWNVTLGGNLIVNGDFEAGNSGFTSGYTYKVDGAANNELVPENSYGVGPNSSTYHPLFNGVGRSGNFMIVNGNTSTIKTVWSQPVTVEAGKEYTFTINVSNVYPLNTANLRFMLGANQIGLFTPVVDGVSQWFNFTTSYTPSASGLMDLSVINDNLSKVGNDFGIDDISFAKVCVEEVSSCYANEVISFNQKKQNDGSTVSTSRSNPAKALGAPQNNDTQNFVSLGFGGDITLKFAGPIKNGEGNDVRVIESTFGNTSCARYPETIRAFASQDGCNFIWIGDGCQDTDFDLGSLAWAQYIKLVDISPIDATYQGTPIADAYDLDGIMCLNGSEENPVPSALVSGTATQVISYAPGTRKNGTPVPASRAIPTNALGLPEGTNAVNFVALGFGGSLVLKFDYVIFDNPLTTDIRITETSFGNPSCAAYGEKAMVEGSLDGINWILLTDEDVCLDGEVDINNAGVIQYVRITDRSASTRFSGPADGYDVDGLTIINGCSSAAPSARMSDNTTTANEVASAEVFPNPFNESTNVEITTGDLDNSVTIRVVNYLGQQVYVETLNVASSSVVRHNVAMNDLSKGVYFLTVETNSTKETVKLVKN